MILEPHMSDRYAALIQKESLEYFVVNDIREGKFSQSIKSIFNRLGKGRIISKEYGNLKNVLNKKGIKKIFLSNSEGYIAINFIHHIRRDFSHIELVAIQHGLLPLRKVKFLKVRETLNSIIYFVFGVKPFGLGFGPKVVDSYFVYNLQIKQFLLRNYTWNDEDVFVKLEFIKPDLFALKADSVKKNDVAVFFTQSLSASGLCSVADERFLNQKTLYFIAERHQQVLIKQHPTDKFGLDFPIPSNCKIEESLNSAFINSSFAYSYFSTALIDSEIFEMETFAVFSERLNVDASVYEAFKTVINIDEYI